MVERTFAAAVAIDSMKRSGFYESRGSALSSLYTTENDCDVLIFDNNSGADAGESIRACDRLVELDENCRRWYGWRIGVVLNVSDGELQERRRLDALRISVSNFGSADG